MTSGNDQRKSLWDDVFILAQAGTGGIRSVPLYGITRLRITQKPYYDHSAGFNKLLSCPFHGTA